MAVDSLSIVVPAYNERERLPRTLESIAKHFGESRREVEVIVVDDGSLDATVDVARAEAERLGLELRALSYHPNRGKGHAVRVGMLAATHDAVLLTDADESVPIEAVDGFLDRLRAGADVVIGSRRVEGAQLAVRQAPLRERLGTVFRDLASWIVPGVSDFTCGFKLFRRAAAQRVFARQQLEGWGYDVEIVLIARRLGLDLVEAPVEWSDDDRTRVRLWKDALGSALDLVRIAWNDRRGRYTGAESADS